MAADTPEATRLTYQQRAEGFCDKSPDGAHCSHWWDCEPCHHCGFDGGGEDCDCPRHTEERNRV